ncbi:MAG TPA: hypothetical protein VF173_30290 [Thermoanaerobaculia bacterium]|nr:hypothetical protein [Thermoanaerobaculia bacterium]
MAAPSGYDDSVFINCPFTPDYQGIFRSLVFAVADCGFVPRSALEKSDSGETRIEKLYRIIRECRYGLHDISVTESDPINNLPRFNMPLELGIFLGAREFGSRVHRDKGCLILDRERFRYQIFCSDLSGQDPKVHNGMPSDAVKCVRNWLRAERPGVRPPSGERMWQRFEKFTTVLPVICDGLLLEPDSPEFHDLTTVIEEWLRDNPR